MPVELNFAACTELFYPLFNPGLAKPRSFAEIACLIREIGYSAIEIAPATLKPRVMELSDAEIRAFRTQADDAGVKVAGLHWLGAKVEGVNIHLTSDDPGPRRAMADYLVRLGEICAILGGKVMVFGSPAQRKLPDQADFEDGLKRAAEVFRSAAERLSESGVEIAIEGLGPDETDFLVNMGEVLELARQVGHPGVGYMLDVKALYAQTHCQRDVLALIRTNGRDALHFHVNDANRRRPGAGDVDFIKIFGALAQSHFGRFTSVEAFDLGGEEPEKVFVDALAYMQECAATLS